MKTGVNVRTSSAILCVVLISFFLCACIQGMTATKRPSDVKPVAALTPKTFPETSREAFVQMENVIGVYAIDNYHTAIFPKRGLQNKPVKEFFLELEQICDHFGNLKYKTLRYDPLTEKKEPRLVPANENAVGVLASLKKPWEVADAFQLDDVLIRKIPRKDALTQIFWTLSKEPKDAYGIPRLADHSGSNQFLYNTRGYVIEHKKSQNFIFKTECIENTNEIHISPGDGNLAKKLKKIFTRRVLWDKYPREVSDLFQYLVAFSKRNGGTHKWVINGKKNVTDYQAFLDIQSSLIKQEMAPPNKRRYLYYYPVWYFCYEGADNKFIVKHKKNKYYVFFNRTIDEL